MLGVLKNQIPLSNRIRERFAHGFPSEIRHARVRSGDNRKKAFTQPLKRSYCQHCSPKKEKKKEKKRGRPVLSLSLNELAEERRLAYIDR